MVSFFFFFWVSINSRVQWRVTYVANFACTLAKKTPCGIAIRHYLCLICIRIQICVTLYQRINIAFRHYTSAPSCHRASCLKQLRNNWSNLICLWVILKTNFNQRHEYWQLKINWNLNIIDEKILIQSIEMNSNGILWASFTIYIKFHLKSKYSLSLDCFIDLYIR